MKEKTVLFWLGGTFMAIFAVIFLWQQILFNSGDNHFRESIEKTVGYAKAGDWENADKEAGKVREMWEAGSPIIAVKYAENDYMSLNLCLMRFNMAVEQRDTGEIAGEGAAAVYFFENSISVAPQP